ncbi:MAG: hypothetical protein WBW53_18830 [Terriglobales bacterium]
MRKVKRYVALLSSVVLALAVGAAVAETAGSNDSRAKPVNNMSAKSSPEAGKTAGEQVKKTSMGSADHVLAPAEELSGTIAFIGSSDKEITLVGANGVPYDFRLTPKSKVDLAGKQIGRSDLASEKNREATIRFLPTTGGNLAESVKISAS